MPNESDVLLWTFMQKSIIFLAGLKRIDVEDDQIRIRVNGEIDLTLAEFIDANDLDYMHDAIKWARTAVEGEVFYCGGGAAETFWLLRLP